MSESKSYPLINLIQSQDYQVLAIDDGKQNLDSSILEGLNLPDIKGGLGVIIDGARPSWLISHISMFYKNIAPWVAVSVPRDLNAVVAWSMRPDVKAGSVIPFVLSEVKAA